jgi:hypothetical protein
MGIYRKYDEFGETKRPWKIHPVWRGIGCLLLILLPLMAYGIAVLIVDANKINRWIPFPPELTGPAEFPYLYANLGVAVLVFMILFGLFTIIYFLIYRMFGPPTYGPMDAPPPRGRNRKWRP